MNSTTALLLLLSLFVIVSAVLASDSNSPKIADAKVVICTIVVKEEKFVDEWLRYHQYLGFDQVYLYDNSDTPSEYLLGLTEVYGDFLVVIHHPGENKQILVYHDFWTKHKHENMWAAILDADEFIVLRMHETIQSFLWDLAPNGGAIEFNWRRFSNCGVKKRGPGPVVSRFTYTTEELSHYMKSISYVPHADMLHIHHSTLLPGKTKTDVMGRPQPIDRHAFLNNNVGNRDIAYVAHYHTKSLEEYVGKRQRGQADHLDRGGYASYTNIASEFERYNTPYCEIQDTFARDFYLRHYFGGAYMPGNTSGDGRRPPTARTSLPRPKDNTPIQCNSEKQLYLYINGTARPFNSWNAFVSRGFDLDNVVKLPRWQCNKMPAGAPLD